MSARPIPKWVTPYIFIPFAESGASVQGCNCYGLVRLILRQEKDINIRDLGHVKYRGVLDNKDVLKYVAEEAPVYQKVELNQIRAFDIVILKIEGRPIHVGLMIDTHRFIHVIEGRNSTVESLRDQIWQNCVASILRHPDLADREVVA